MKKCEARGPIVHLTCNNLCYIKTCDENDMCTCNKDPNEDPTAVRKWCCNRCEGNMCYCPDKCNSC